MILGLLIIPWISFMRPWLDRFLLAVAHCDACNPLTIDIRAAIEATGRAYHLHLLLCTCVLADRKLCPCRHWQQRIWT